MKRKTLYIVPGHNETTRRKPYQALSRLAAKKGYTVVKINPNWKKSLSSQVFEVNDGAVVVAFSLGAILTLLSVEKSNSKKIILASPTTHLCADDLKGILPKEIVKDVRSVEGIYPKNTLYFYGEKEKDLIPVYVPKNIKVKKLIPATGHFLSPAYLKEINKYL